MQVRSRNIPPNHLHQGVLQPPWSRTLAVQPCKFGAEIFHQIIFIKVFCSHRGAVPWPFNYASSEQKYSTKSSSSRCFAATVEPYPGRSTMQVRSRNIPPNHLHQGVLQPPWSRTLAVQPC